MKTDISILLDRSGSMATIAGDTIGGFNTWLKSQKAEPGSATLSLAQFDSEGFDYTCRNTDIQMVADLSYATFSPRGSTPLLDSMARLINETGARLREMSPSARPDKVIMVIITDGEENASREKTYQQVCDMVNHQRDKYGWEFIYLGANQDAIKVGQSIGVLPQFSGTYTNQNTTAAYNVLNRATASLRAGMSVDLAGFTAAEQSAMTDNDNQASA